MTIIVFCRFISFAATNCSGHSSAPARPAALTLGRDHVLLDSGRNPVKDKIVLDFFVSTKGA